MKMDFEVIVFRKVNVSTSLFTRSVARLKVHVLSKFVRAVSLFTVVACVPEVTSHMRL